MDRATNKDFGFTPWANWAGFWVNISISSPFWDVLEQLWGLLPYLKDYQILKIGGIPTDNPFTDSGGSRSGGNLAETQMKKK